MKNLMTRKCVFGVLMACVLAFGVQFTADGIKTGADDFALAAKVGDVAQIDLGHLSIGTTVTLTITASPDIGTTDKESVTISIDGRGASISLDGATGKKSHTFTEETDNDNNQVFTIGTLTFRVINAGKINIKLKDTTLSSNIPSGDERAPEKVLTFYAVKSLVPSTASISLAGISNGIKTGYVFGTQLVYPGDSNHYPVTYTCTDGTAYIQEGNRTSTAASSFTTSSAAKVYLSERNGSVTVTAQVTGGRSFVGAYIYGNPTLATPTTILTSDNTDNNNPGNRPANAFTAIVNDGASTPAGVNGVPVKFEVKDKSESSGGWLIPGPGNTIVDSTNKLIEDPPLSAKILYVRTKKLTTGANSGDGRAQIGYRVGSAGREQVVIVSGSG